MNGIVALGPHAGPFLEDPVHVVHADPEPVLDGLVPLHTLITEQLEYQSAVLVVFPERYKKQASHAMRAVRSALDGAPVLWRSLPVSPLTADVTVTLAGAIADQIGGVTGVHELLPEIAKQLINVTWLPTIKNLREPNPTVWQHAKSMAPKKSWLVTNWPEPAVVEFKEAETIRMPNASFELGVALADQDGNRDWIEPVITTRLENAVGVQVPSPKGSASYWGVPKLTEVVIYPRDLDVLVQAVKTTTEVQLCAWCHREVAAERCPWCQLPRNGTLGTIISSVSEPEQAMEKKS